MLNKNAFGQLVRFYRELRGWSQAYADLGLIDAAATPAQDALVVMKQIKSRVHILRIAGLQGQLSQLDSKHIEVIRLGVMVNS